MKRRTVILVAGFVALGCLFAYGLSALGLANESWVLKTFRAHRETFEQLKAIMLSEGSIEYVSSDWVAIGHRDIQNTDSGFPLEKFTRYHALLRRAHALAIRRNVEPPQEINFLLDRTGFAGDSIHTGVCWRDVPPEDLVPSFKSYRWPSTGNKRHSIYIHVDDNWYLWRD